MKLLIVIPAYNEEGSIVRTVERLRPYLQPEWDFVVVNDGSRDRTAALCREHGYALLDLPVNLGLPGAFQAGVLCAERMGCDYVVQFDADGQHRPEYIRPMLERMERDGLDIVIGSRFLTMKRPLTVRMIGSRLLSAAIRLTTRTRLTDPTSGMRMLDRRMIEEFSGNINYGPEPDTVAYLIRNGAKVAEQPISMDERTAGTSYLGFGRSLRYMVNMFVSILLVQFFRPKRSL